MTKAFHKHKLLLNEHMHHRRAYPTLNEHFDVKHISADLHLGGLKDPRVYDVAVASGRILITRNDRHFRPMVGSKNDAGVIGIPPHRPARELDTKLTALLMKHNPAYFKGRVRGLEAEEEAA